MTTERSGIVWTGGESTATATTEQASPNNEGAVEPGTKQVDVVEKSGEYRDSTIGVFRDAGGNWATEVRFREGLGAAPWSSKATSEAEAITLACDRVDAAEELAASAPSEPEAGSNS